MPAKKTLIVIGPIAAVLLLIVLPVLSPPETKIINQRGSDTILLLAQRWAEVYSDLHPDIPIAVSGGGSGTGIAALINGRVDLADSSRPIKTREMNDASRAGVNPVEWKVALDGLSAVVHPSNPIGSLTLDQLRAIYTGVITDWSEVGGTPGVIVAYGRQSNSGTYIFWKELVLGNEDYRSDMLHLNGNADIVEAVSQDPRGIAYVGIAYVVQRQGDIKILGVKTAESGDPLFPTLETILDGTYPISRFLYIYTDGVPQGAVRDYLRWILGHDGQEIVEEQGYIPIPTSLMEEQLGQLI